MTAISPNDTSRNWHRQDRSPPVQLYLADRDGVLGGFVGSRVAGFPINVFPVEVDAQIDTESLANAAAAVIEVSADVAASIERFAKLAKTTQVPLIAAAYNPPLALVRSLVRVGAHDVVPLPLDLRELETSLQLVRDWLAQKQKTATTASGKVVSVIKSGGGAGATSLLSQMAIRSAERQASAGREVCLIDLDVQFGDAAFQLGLQPSLSLSDLFSAGSRMDGELLRSVATTHASSLRVISSPAEIMPLEAVSQDRVLEIVELASREFGLVYLDLPSNWTNWSLSLLARSDIVLLAAELTIPSLNRARRQIELLRSQLAGLDLRVIINRYEKSLFKSIKPADVRRALGQEIAFTISNEPQIMRAATERGVPLNEIKKRSAVGKDIDQVVENIAQSLAPET